MDIGAVNLWNQDSFFAQVDKRLDLADGMLAGSPPSTYFSTGANALMNIRACLTRTHPHESDIKAILDYACGYGRVIRWLKAAYPDASIVGADADRKSVESIRYNLDADARQIDLALQSRIGGPFDLIWIGSLFTHISRDEFIRTLVYVSRHLRKRGVIVFTTHGTLVSQRIRTGERSYNLDHHGASKIISEYDDCGYGFANYPNMADYGISISTEESVRDIIKLAGLEIVSFVPIGWVKHQDLFCCSIGDLGL